MGVAIVIVAFVLFVYQTPEGSENMQNKVGEITVVDNQVFKNVAGAVFSDADSDNDGLRDWEEPLWKTDVNNPDSDGDGTPDGEEVDQNRDPTVPAPNDVRTTIPSNTNASTNDSLTATEKYARTFLTDYFDLKKAGQLNSPLGQNLIFQNFNDAIPPIKRSNYVKEDFTIIESSPQTLHRFGNNVGNILKTYWTAGEESVYEIINLSLILEKREEIKKLDPVIESYADIIDQLLVLPVPDESIDSYLNIINGLDLAYASLVPLRNVFIDPFSAIPSIENYKRGAEEIVKGLRLLKIDFDLKNVEFKEGEGGYPLTHLPF